MQPFYRLSFILVLLFFAGSVQSKVDETVDSISIQNFDFDKLMNPSTLSGMPDPPTVPHLPPFSEAAPAKPADTSQYDDSWKKLRIGTYEETSDFKKRVDNARQQADNSYEKQQRTYETTVKNWESQYVQWEKRKTKHKEDIEESQKNYQNALKNYQEALEKWKKERIVMWLPFALKFNDSNFNRSSKTFEQVECSQKKEWLERKRTSDNLEVIQLSCIISFPITIPFSTLSEAEEFKQQNDRGELTAWCATAMRLVGKDKTSKTITIREAEVEEREVLNSGGVAQRAMLGILIGLALSGYELNDQGGELPPLEPAFKKERYVKRPAVYGTLNILKAKYEYQRIVENEILIGNKDGKLIKTVIISE